MTSDEILRYLKDLNDKLKVNEVNGELSIYGGAVMCMCFNARPSTNDVDGWFAPKQEMYDAIHAVAYDNGLPDDWLNDAMKGFVSSRDDTIIFLELSNLKIYRPRDEYQLAMKLMACRIGNDENDEYDIRFLLERIGVESTEQAEDILCKYFPSNMVLPKTHYLLLEILGR